MTALLDDLAVLLQAEGIGTVATDLFKGRMPDAPDTCLAIRALPGQAPLFTHDGFTYQRPRVQVLARGATYAAAEAKAADAFRVLSRITNGGLAGRPILRVEPVQSPFELDHDENDRVLYVFNADVLLGDAG